MKADLVSGRRDTYLLAALGVVVIERLRGAERFHEREVSRRACGYDRGTAGVQRILQRQRARRCTRAVHEHGVAGRFATAGQRQLEALVERLAAGEDADGERTGILEAEVVRDADLHVTLGYAVSDEWRWLALDVREMDAWVDLLAEHAVLWLHCVSSVAEAGYPV